MNDTTEAINKWLKTNTYHFGEFEDVQKLVEAKEKAGFSISVCIPTLNEEETIGREVRILKSELMDRFPLVDEIAVVDSGSTDDTLSIAASFGADTYLAEDILPDYGFKPGKGENLWKAVYQLQGDVICYVDGDIKNIHPRFVTGLVAPLIYRSEIQYVKAFYDRPIANSNGISPSGGGRVTEILVRPLFSLFFPELTAMVQPLSGEYAVRREVLEEIPFPVGYGVETAHLIDVYQKRGLDAFAQTDLESRIHHNQTNSDLGKMSFEILQSFLKRLGDSGEIAEAFRTENIFRQFKMGTDMTEQVITEIIEEERPPMNSIKEYHSRGQPMASFNGSSL